jgi:uncharacterized DUF497 family protein
MLSIAYRWHESDPQTTTIRVISARKATHSEIRYYEKSL